MERIFTKWWIKWIARIGLLIYAIHDIIHTIADNIPLNFLGIYDCVARFSVWLIIGWYTYKVIENTK